jgi:hypothetical protein
MIPFDKNYLSTVGTGFGWQCKILPASRSVKTYYEETKLSAEKIWEARLGPLYLMYSGGVDSEYILNVFLQLGMPIQPVIIKLNNYNYHDIKYAIDFCKSKKIEPLIIDFNFDQFVTSGEILDVANVAECSHWNLPSTFKVTSQLQGTVLLGSHGPPHLTLNQGLEKTWYIREDEVLHSVLKWFSKKNIYGNPFFLVHSAEQYLAWLLEPTTLDLVDFNFPGKLGNTSTKGLVYNNNPDFKLEARPKFTGFENIVSAPIFKHPNIHTMLFKAVPPIPTCNGYYIEEYHSMTKRLGEYQCIP